MNVLLSIAIFLILGLGVGRLFQRIKLPMVTAYLLIGVLIGPFCLNLVAPSIFKTIGTFSEFILGMIAFTIGGSFTVSNVKKVGKSIVIISIFECVLACALVWLSFALLLKKPLPISILFGSIAAATAPAATVAVIREFKAKGILTQTLLGVVAADDAWGLILFAVALGISKALLGGMNPSIPKVFGLVLLRVFGAFGLGILIGWLFSLASRFLRTREETLVFTLGFIILTIGIAKAANFSVLLANMALGATIVNFSRRERRFFEAIESIEPPLFLMFFALAGAALDIPMLTKLGLLGAVYLIARVVGKLIGASIGVKVVRTAKAVRWLGLGLVPQAGAALGMALLVKAQLPELGGIVLTTIIGTTIIYEIIGPLCTKFALLKAGEIGGERL